MRTSDFTPLSRSTVGFDRLLVPLDSGLRSEWPPYDVEKLNDQEYRISLAVAGFDQSEIEITQVGPDLVVVGRRDMQDDGRMLLHRGIANQSFKQVFNLADHVKVARANLAHGMLSIDLIREVPEQMKPRKIEIGQNGPSLGGQKQISQTVGGPAKAA